MKLPDFPLIFKDHYGTLLIFSSAKGAKDVYNEYRDFFPDEFDEPEVYAGRIERDEYKFLTRLKERAEETEEDIDYLNLLYAISTSGYGEDSFEKFKGSIVFVGV